MAFHLFKTTTGLKRNLLIIAGVLIFLILLFHPYTSLSPLSLSALFGKKAQWEFTSPHQIPLIEDDAFKKIDDNLFVFSAFFDDMSDPNKILTRIVAIDILNREWKPPLNCHFYDGNYKFLIIVESAKVTTKDGGRIPIPGLTFFLCEIPQSISRSFPIFVQLRKEESGSRILNNDTAQDHLVKIHYQPSKMSPFLYQVAMCVQPLNFPGAKAPLFLLEWIEYYLLLGVEHITFYNYNVSLEITVLLESYSKGGKIRVIEWPVPFPGVKVQDKLSAHHVAITDCAHRYRGFAKYVIAVDTDEFLVPSKNHSSFPKYFDELWKDRNISHIQFTSKFWFKSFPRGYYSVNLGGERFNTLANNLLIPTATTFFWGKQRKFVMRPDLVIESGIHGVTYPVNGSTSKAIWRWDVENGDGFYLHFKDCTSFFHKANRVLSENQTCLETKGSFQDVQPAKRFGNLLVQRVVDKINESVVLKKMLL